MTATPQAEVFTLEDLKQGATAVVEFSVSADDMRQFAELSGDHNPLHTSDDFARSKGFEGAVVYGALTIAKISQLIGMRLPGRDAIWASIALDYRKPLYVGQTARVEGELLDVSESTRMLTLKLTGRIGDKLFVKGKAEVALGH